MEPTLAYLLTYGKPHPSEETIHSHLPASNKCGDHWMFYFQFEGMSLDQHLDRYNASTRMKYYSPYEAPESHATDYCSFDELVEKSKIEFGVSGTCLPLGKFVLAPEIDLDRIELSLIRNSSFHVFRHYVYSPTRIKDTSYTLTMHRRILFCLFLRDCVPSSLTFPPPQGHRLCYVLSEYIRIFSLLFPHPLHTIYFGCAKEHYHDKPCPFDPDMQYNPHFHDRLFCWHYCGHNSPNTDNIEDWSPPSPRSYADSTDSDYESDPDVDPRYSAEDRYVEAHDHLQESRFQSLFSLGETILGTVTKTIGTLTGDTPLSAATASDPHVATTVKKWIPQAMDDEFQPLQDLSNVASSSAGPFDLLNMASVVQPELLPVAAAANALRGSRRGRERQPRPCKKEPAPLPPSDSPSMEPYWHPSVREPVPPRAPGKSLNRPIFTQDDAIQKRQAHTERVDYEASRRKVFDHTIAFIHMAVVVRQQLSEPYYSSLVAQYASALYDNPGDKPSDVKKRNDAVNSLAETEKLRTRTEKLSTILSLLDGLQNDDNINWSKPSDVAKQWTTLERIVKAFRSCSPMHLPSTNTAITIQKFQSTLSQLVTLANYNRETFTGASLDALKRRCRQCTEGLFGSQEVKRMQGLDGFISPGASAAMKMTSKKKNKDIATRSTLSIKQAIKTDKLTRKEETAAKNALKKRNGGEVTRDFKKGKNKRSQFQGFFGLTDYIRGSIARVFVNDELAQNCNTVAEYCTWLVDKRSYTYVPTKEEIKVACTLIDLQELNDYVHKAYPQNHRDAIALFTAKHLHKDFVLKPLAVKPGKIIPPESKTLFVMLKEKFAAFTNMLSLKLVGDTITEWVTKAFNSFLDQVSTIWSICKGVVIDLSDFLLKCFQRAAELCGITLPWLPISVTLPGDVQDALEAEGTPPHELSTPSVEPVPSSSSSVPTKESVCQGPVDYIEDFVSRSSRYFGDRAKHYKEALLNNNTFMTDMRSANTLSSFLRNAFAAIAFVGAAVMSFYMYIERKISGKPSLKEELVSTNLLLDEVDEVDRMTVQQANGIMESNASLVAKTSSFFSDSYLRTLFTHTIHRLKTHLHNAKLILKASSARNEPLFVYLCGAAGIGKTSMVQAMIQVVLGCDSENARQNTYPWDYLGYQDSYQGQKAIVFEDIFNTKTEEADVDTSAAILQLVSNNFWTMPVADPTKKGQLVVCPDVVIATSNMVVLPVKEALRDFDALKRRRHIVVEMMESNNINFAHCPPLYQNKLFVVKNTFSETDQTYWTPMDFVSFMRYLHGVNCAWKSLKPTVSGNSDLTTLDGFLASLSLSIPAPQEQCDPQVLSVYKRSNGYLPPVVSDGDIRQKTACEALANQITKSYPVTDGVNHTEAGVCISGRFARVDDAEVPPAPPLCYLMADAFNGVSQIVPCKLRNLHNFVEIPIADVSWFGRIILGVIRHRELIKNTFMVAVGALAIYLAATQVVATLAFDWVTSKFQNASGHSDTYVPRVIRTIAPAAHTVRSGLQDNAAFIGKLSDSIVSIVYKLEDNSYGFFQGTLIDQKLLMTNRHSFNTFDYFEKKGKAFTWFIHRANRVVEMPPIDWDTQVCNYSDTDLVFYRIPDHLFPQFEGQKSIINAFIGRASDVKVDSCKFTTLRKVANREFQMAKLMEVSRPRVMNISAETAAKTRVIFNSCFVVDVDSCAGACGSLLMVNQIDKICGVHISGTAHTADFCPVDKIVINEARVHFGLPTTLVTTISAEPPKDSVQQSHPNHPIREHAKVTVFRQQRAILSGPISLKTLVHFPLPDRVSSLLHTLTGPCLTQFRLHYERYETISPDPQNLTLRQFYASYLQELQNRILWDPLTWTPLLTASLVALQQSTQPPLGEVISLPESGCDMIVRPLYAVPRIGSSRQVRCVQLYIDYPHSTSCRSMSKMPSKLNVFRSQKLEPVRVGSSRSCRFHSSCTCDPTPYRSWTFSSPPGLTLVLCRASTPIVPTFTVSRPGFPHSGLVQPSLMAIIPGSTMPYLTASAVLCSGTLADSSPRPTELVWRKLAGALQLIAISLTDMSITATPGTAPVSLLRFFTTALPIRSSCIRPYFKSSERSYRPDIQVLRMTFYPTSTQTPAMLTSGMTTCSLCHRCSRLPPLSFNAYLLDGRLTILLPRRLQKSLSRHPLIKLSSSNADSGLIHRESLLRLLTLTRSLNHYFGVVFNALLHRWLPQMQSSPRCAMKSHCAVIQQLNALGCTWIFSTTHNFWLPALTTTFKQGLLTLGSTLIQAHSTSLGVSMLSALVSPKRKGKRSSLTCLPELTPDRS